MKLDPEKVYGSVPETFSRRVEYALRRCEMEETKTMKRMPVAVIFVTILLLAMTTTAMAAVLSKTTEFFGQLYGIDYHNKLETGTNYVGKQSTILNDVVFTLNDIISNEFRSQLPTEDGTDYYELTAPFFFTTGTISAVPEGNLVLCPRDAFDWYTIDSPAGYALFYGDMYPAPPEGAPSYADLAREKNACLRMVEIIPNGLMDENGNFYMGCVGYNLIPQEDGTIFFSAEIQPEVIVPEQDSYQLSFYIRTFDVDHQGNEIDGTRQSADWIVTLVPEKAE